MDRDGEVFQTMLSKVCRSLAEGVVKDGEGATKLVEILIRGARNAKEAKQAAYAVAHSPLVKTAFFGEDANWGRILCALGYSGAHIDPNRIDVLFDKTPIVRNGIGVGVRLEEKAGQVLKNKSLRVTVDLHQGKSALAKLRIDRRVVLGKDAKAQVRTKGFLGETYIDLMPGNPDTGRSTSRSSRTPQMGTVTRPARPR